MKQPITDEQLELIFRYLDGELSEEEEAAFIAQLQADAALQTALDQQVIMSNYLSKEMAEPVAGNIPEAADVFITKVTNTFKEKDITQTTVIPIANKKYNVRLAVAAAGIVVFVLSGLVYYLLRDRLDNNNIVHQRGWDSIPVVKQVTLQPDSSRLLASVDMEETYKEYYTILANDALKVPAAATPYESLYKQHNYKEMAVKTEKVLDVKGQNPTDDKTKNYFNFYKALSNLEIGKPDVAERLLREVIVKSTGDIKLNQQVSWYLLMVYLKKRNKKNAVLIAETIASNKGNPYYKEAITIKTALQK